MYDGAMIVNCYLKVFRMADTLLPEDLDRVTFRIMGALEGSDIPLAVMGLVNSLAHLIKQMPEENHEDALSNTTDMLMNLMGYMQIDMNELQNATKH